MGSRIHRAIGWGLREDAFARATRLDDHEDGPFEALQELLDRRDATGLTIPAGEGREIEASDGDGRIRAPIIVCRDLLNASADPSRTETGRARDLATYAGRGELEETAWILFAPNLYYAKRWHRGDDDVDYAFERWLHDEPRDFAKEARFGFYPFTSEMMHPDGTPARFAAHAGSGLVAAVPSEIRWYLKTLGVIGDEAINTLRPMLVQWWS